MNTIPASALPKSAAVLLVEKRCENGALTLAFDGLPPSANNAYATVYPKGRPPIRVLSNEGKAFKRSVIVQVAPLAARLDPAKFYLVQLDIYADIIQLDGEARRFDTSNRIKLTEDALAEALGFDDRRVKRIEAEKHHRPEKPGFTVVVTPVQPRKDIFQGR